MPARRHSSRRPCVRIRRAAPRDLAALVELENRTFVTDIMSERQLRHHVGNASAAVLVAVRCAEVVGSAVLLLHARHRSARLYSIAVSSSARGAGIGEMLLAAVERAAKTRGRDRMRLEVRRDNAGARKLYERNGYRGIGIRKRYYEDGQDAQRYEKILAHRRVPTGPDAGQR